MLCESNHHRVVSRRGRARCKSCGDWKGVAHVYVYLFVFVGAAIIVVIAARKVLAREIRTVTDQLRAKSRLHGFDRALPTLWTVARQAIYTITVMSQVRTIERQCEIPHEGPFADLVWSDPEEIAGWGLSPRGALAASSFFRVFVRREVDSRYSERPKRRRESGQPATA